MDRRTFLGSSAATVLSSTVGSAVQVHLPDGSLLDGTAEGVDWDGRLVVRTPAGTVELASGDVRHVRTRAAEA